MLCLMYIYTMDSSYTLHILHNGFYSHFKYEQLNAIFKCIYLSYQQIFQQT